jgi:adenosyl cobinamide kinase/adenosyl cobinamide phosphate guanylyltransferase
MIVLVIGGTRSGKSHVGERLAARLGEPVTVIVPASAGDDPELTARIDEHRARRPATWTTVECGADLIEDLGRATGTVLIDSLGTWIAASPDLTVDVTSIIDVLRTRTAATVVVTEEVGLAVHATTDAGRRFTDALGTLNSAVAAIADDVLIVIAGRAVRLSPVESVELGT